MKVKVNQYLSYSVISKENKVKNVCVLKTGWKNATKFRLL